MSHFNKQPLNQGYFTRDYREESLPNNTKADNEAVEKRRRLEAILESKRLRDADPADPIWLDMWSM